MLSRAGYRNDIINSAEIEIKIKEAAKAKRDAKN